MKEKEAFKDAVAILLVFGGLILVLLYGIYSFLSSTVFEDKIFSSIIAGCFLLGGIYGFWQKRVLAVGRTKAILVKGNEAIFFSALYILMGGFIIYLLLT